MKLSERQRDFTRRLTKLLVWAHRQGFEITLGDAYRSPQYAKTRGKMGARSLHCKRLAVDLNLWLGGKYQRKASTHKPLGHYWESIGGTWGGRFGDANHYSLEWKGRK